MSRPAFTFAQRLAITLLSCAVSLSAATKSCNDACLHARDVRQAASLYRQGVDAVRHDDLTRAQQLFEQSAALDPTQLRAALAEANVSQQLASQHLKHGNQLLLDGDRTGALAHFREAAALDPTNDYLQQRIADASPSPELAPRIASTQLEYAEEPHLAPAAGRHDFHVRGDGRELWQQFARAFGLTVDFDSTFQSRAVRFDLEGADFPTSLTAVQLATHAFYLPMSARQMVVAADTLENRKKLEHTSLRTIYLPESSGPQDLNDHMNLLRTMFDVRFIVPETSMQALVVRAPRKTLDAVEQLFDELDRGKPEVLLEVHTIQVRHTLSRDVGLNLPLQFTLFNVPSELRNLINNPDANNLIQQFLNGGLNATDAAALAALLASSSSTQSSPLLKPFATFGGGNTLTGINLPTIGLKFTETRDWFAGLDQLSLRAQQGSAATLRIGDRYPVVTAAYQPLALNPLLQKGLASAGLGNLTGANPQQTVPQFTYEDLGLTLKVTPTVSASGDVAMALELQVKSLTGQSVNDVPVISNREYKANITARLDQTAVLAGAISESEQRSINGLPLLARLPGVGGTLFGTTNVQRDSSQLLIVITPHLLRGGHTGPGREIYLEGN